METIGQLPSANGIDGAADYLAIETASPHATNKINRNIFLGVTAQPVDISSVQTLTNKVIGITNTVTLSDTLFTLQDNSDNTKQALFQLSGITTGTTRTYTLPNVTDTLVSLTATQTLTNKTLTSPAISGGTIDNTTITVDSIAGHTTSTVVNVANMQISNGVINTANAVTSTSIASGAVQPQALQSGTGSGWTWTTYAPTLTNITQGNGVLTANYIQIGKTVFVKIKFILGNTSAMGTGPTFSLPVTANSYYSDGNAMCGWGIVTAGGVESEIVSQLRSTTTVRPTLVGGAATYLGPTANISASVPGSWTTSDFINIQFFYEAA